MNLQRARDWADLVLKILSTVAIIAGGWWAHYQFSIADTDASNIQLAVTTESQPYSEDFRLLVVHAKPKNIGKVPVTPGKDGFVVTVKSVPKNARAGILDLEKLPDLYKTDLLKRFPKGYELEPGVEYDEVLALVVPKGSVYAIEAVLDLDDDAEVDHTTVAQVPAEYESTPEQPIAHKAQ